ncbi:MAG: PHP domain-containing protein, partial [Evtepia sp.]
MEKIPFLKMFSACSSALQKYVADWMIDTAVIDASNRQLEVNIQCLVQPDETLLTSVRREIAEIYQLNQVAILYVIMDAPLPNEPALPEEPSACEETSKEAETQDIFQQTEELRRVAMQKGISHGAKKARIYGTRAIKKKPIPIHDLDLDMGTVVVEGDVFFIEHREMKKRGAWLISFDVTDYTGSIRIKKFMQGEEGVPIAQQVKKGQRLLIQGRLNLDRYDNDMVLEPLIIQTTEKPKKPDNAAEKRVELHVHTKMSTMDALDDAKSLVSRAIEWGHPAIAITDHGVAQSFPDAWNASKEKIKILFGVEAYFINNVDEKRTVHGTMDAELKAPIVAFDLETTGLSKQSDLITEIGAVILRDGAVAER